MKQILKYVSLFVVPIAWPAWTGENIYRRISKRFWEFDVWSGSFYIVFLVGVAFLLLLSPSLFLRVLGLYVFLALEVLGIFICAAVVFGDAGEYKTTIAHLARRQTPVSGNLKPLGVKEVWIAITSYLYSAFFFGVLDYFLFMFDDTTYVGVQSKPVIETLFDFIYFSYVSMVSFGFADIFPAKIISKLSYMVEISIGLLFMLFILSLFANHFISRRLGN